MQGKRNLGYLAVVILAVIAPTLVSLGWYQLSKNPSLRPLGITKQALSAYNGGLDGVELVAYVDWVPPRTGNFTKAQLTRDLTTSFAAKGAEARIVFRDGVGTTRITYVIGQSRLGPYTIARAAEGIVAAVEAYRMH